MLRGHRNFHENPHKVEFSTLHRRQEAHFETLRRKGYEPIVMWECHWMKMKQTPGTEAHRFMSNFNMYYFPEFR